MPNWSHNAWRQESDDAARLAELKLHIEEVSQRVAEEVSSAGQTVKTKDLLEYLKMLEGQADKLQERVDVTSGARRGGWVRGRARL